ncbi:hypothetical protein OFY05_23200 (plasmid) [Pseudocitrobacter faecalis]|nr:hypothetical protein OFY05_23200 [Pseudocitrobacter faecalis]
MMPKDVLREDRYRTLALSALKTKSHSPVWANAHGNSTSTQTLLRLDVIESLVECCCWRKDTCPRTPADVWKLAIRNTTKSQIVEMYRDKPLPEIIAALQAIDERRAKESSPAETEEA